MSEKRISWKKRYAICIVTGVVLLFLVEIVLHLWVKSPHDKKEVAERKGKLADLNNAVLHALDDARPWGMLASFDDRLKSSQYSLTAWSLVEPFNLTAKLNRENRPVASETDWTNEMDRAARLSPTQRFNNEIERRLDALAEANSPKITPRGPYAMWSNLTPEQASERFDAYHQLGKKNFPKRTLTQILGWPDALIYMFRETFSGSVPSKIFSGIALLIVTPFVVLCFAAAIREMHVIAFVIFLLLTPLAYSCVAAILWGAMYVFSFLLSEITFFPSGDALAVALPSLAVVGWHIPIMIAHKYVEEKAEKMVEGT